MRRIPSCTRVSTQAVAARHRRGAAARAQADRRVATVADDRVQRAPEVTISPASILEHLGRRPRRRVREGDGSSPARRRGARRESSSAAVHLSEGGLEHGDPPAQRGDLAPPGAVVGVAHLRIPPWRPKSQLYSRLSSSQRSSSRHADQRREPFGVAVNRRRVGLEPIPNGPFAHAERIPRLSGSSPPKSASRRTRQARAAAAAVRLAAIWRSWRNGTWFRTPDSGYPSRSE